MGTDIRSFKESGLSNSSDEDLLKILLSSIGSDYRDFDKFSDNDKKEILKILKEIRNEGFSRTFESLYNIDYWDIPLPIDKWLDHPYYFGNIGKSLYPAWRSDLKYVMDPNNGISEWLLTGAIGIGKSTAAIIGLCYKLYKLLCLKKPHNFYGLGDGSSVIVIALLNVTKSQSSLIALNKFMGLLNNSQWFMDNFREVNFDAKDYSISFPNNIKIISGSQDKHILGSDLYAVLLDEANFMESKISRNLLKDKQRAYQLYTNAYTRMASRFMHEGELPGLACIVSSKGGTSDFLELHIQDNKNRADVYVSDYCIYDEGIKRSNYLKEEFTVLVGDTFHKSRIIEDYELQEFIVPDGCYLIKVPMDFKHDYSLDVDQALRDISGIARDTISNFIPKPFYILQCIDKTRTSPLTKDLIVLNDNSADPTQISKHFIEHYMFKIDRSSMKPIINPNSPRYIHADLALMGTGTGRHDNAAICMLHLCDTEVVSGKDAEGRPYKDLRHKFYVDWIIELTCDEGREISLSKIQEFLMSLPTYGYIIEKITFDQALSRQMMQELRDAGFNVEHFSVDAKKDAYYTLRNMLMARRLSLYKNDKLVRELTDLYEDMKKINHPKGGSKDLSDALAGALFQAVTDSKASISPAREIIPIVGGDNGGYANEYLVELEIVSRSLELQDSRENMVKLRSKKLGKYSWLL